MSMEKSGAQEKEQFRVVINRDANEALEAFIGRLKEGSGSSNITKSDLANYLFQRLDEYLGESEILEIKSLHFDTTQALKALIRQAQNGGDLPDTLREMLLKSCGIKSAPKEKKPKRLSTVSAVDNLPAKDAV